MIYRVFDTLLDAQNWNTAVMQARAASGTHDMRYGALLDPEITQTWSIPVQLLDGRYACSPCPFWEVEGGTEEDLEASAFPCPEPEL